MEIYFATSNKDKFAEAEKVLSALLGKHGITLRQFPFEHNEIRSDSLEEIAREAVEEAYRRCAKPVFVEDSGFFVDALNGFPGAYSAWVLRKIGTRGILRLMQNEKNRKAHFEACVAYHNGEKISIFKGNCKGMISDEGRGKGGFGYDPVFVPEGYSQTFSENIELKNKLSHRYNSLLEFSKNLISGSSYST